MTDVRLVATDTDTGSLVPVASNASGQLAVQSPKIEKVPNDFDVEGDLKVTGSAEFSGAVQVGDNPLNGSDAGTRLGPGGGITACADASSARVWEGYTSGSSALTSSIAADGSASFAGGSDNSDGIRLITSGPDKNPVIGIQGNGAASSNAFSVRDIVGTNSDVIRLQHDGSATFASTVTTGTKAPTEGTTFGVIAYSNTTAEATGSVAARNYGAGSNFIGFNANAVKTFDVTAEGSAEFKGDVTVGSRNKSWMLVEQGGLCHMVEQTRISTGDLVNTTDLVNTASVDNPYPKLRDVFQELNLIEEALSEVMSILRLSPPAGWPVWDGSDETQ